MPQSPRFYGQFLRPAVEGEIAFGNVNKKKVLKEKSKSIKNSCKAKRRLREIQLDKKNSCEEKVGQENSK